jgi:ribosome-binding factor A
MEMMEMSRYLRIAQALKKELSTIIHDELKDPRLGFVTITKVELAPDYRFAKVFFSVLGKDEEYKKTQEALDSSLGFIRKLIAQRISLRFTPELLFKQDRSTEYSVRIEEILGEIKEQDEHRKDSGTDQETP